MAQLHSAAHNLGGWLEEIMRLCIQKGKSSRPSNQRTTNEIFMNLLAQDLQHGRKRVHSSH